MDYGAATSDFVETGSDKTYVLHSGETVTVTDFATAYGEFQGATNCALIVHGKAVSQNGAGALVDAASSDVEITVGASGRLSGATSGIELDGTGGGASNAGRVIGSLGIVLGGTGAEVANSGLVKGTTTGLSVTGSDADIANSGRIVGGSTGVLLGDDSALVNDGLVRGNGGTGVMGSSGDNLVTNGGLIRGDVDLGAGTDLYFVEGGGRVKGKILLGAGSDGAVGGGGGDTFHGGGDSDSLVGLGGDDELFGNAGNDLIVGGRGDDRLHGGDDDDQLSGGAGHDKLWGGAGNDEFVWIAGAGGFAHTGDRGREKVMDWQDGNDKINVHHYNIDAMNQAQFVDDAVTNKNGNAIIHLPSGPGGLHAGTIIIVGAAHMIDIGDFIFT